MGNAHVKWDHKNNPKPWFLFTFHTHANADPVSQATAPPKLIPNRAHSLVGSKVKKF